MFLWCSIASKRFVTERSSNEKKYAPMYYGSKGENRMFVCRIVYVRGIFFLMGGRSTKIFTFSQK